LPLRQKIRQCKKAPSATGLAGCEAAAAASISAQLCALTCGHCSPLLKQGVIQAHPCSRKNMMHTTVALLIAELFQFSDFIHYTFSKKS